MIHFTFRRKREKVIGQSDVKNTEAEADLLDWQTIDENVVVEVTSQEIK